MRKRGLNLKQRKLRAPEGDGLTPAPALTLILRDGSTREYLARSAFPRCGRCVQTGLLPLAKFTLGRWYTTYAACDCVWGADLRRTIPDLLWYDDTELPIRGLSRADLSQLAWHMREKDSLLDAAQRITHPETRDRIIAAVKLAMEAKHDCRIAC